ncbi:MAG: 4-hydroxy-tetrahydrodipicolinate reductase [Mariprofundales bacterium]|nr:4-hydroxy-tetrahydrodipicolinate reductase [Mariprofundales bacterium]
MRVAVVGAGGRMGKMLIRAVAASGSGKLVAATERAGSPQLGVEVADGVVVMDHLQIADSMDVVIDFTAPAATLQHAEFAAEHGVAMVIGTTGFDDRGLRQLRTTLAGQRVVMAANFSVGVNLALGLVEQTAAILGDDYDAEIVETHHRYKVDAPSGTALALGSSLAKGRGVDLKQHAVFSREGVTGARKRGDIGFSVVRAGSIVGDHSTLFISDEEQVEIRHVAHDRMVFAKGAVRAAEWLLSQPHGLYSMADVLGVS